MKLTLKRYIFNTDVRSTIGMLFVDDKEFCYTLEDEIRAKKVDGKTAIPAGDYKVKLTWSPRFKKNLPLIYNTDDGAVDRNGMRFEGVRFHGGNTEEDTHGCPLVAYNTDGKKIWGSASDALVKKFESGKEYDLTIINEI